MVQLFVWFLVIFPCFLVEIFEPHLINLSLKDFWIFLLTWDFFFLVFLFIQGCDWQWDLLYGHSGEGKNKKSLLKRSLFFWNRVWFCDWNFCFGVCVLFLKVDSARRFGNLLEAVQVLTDLNLSIKKAYVSSDGRWFMDGTIENVFPLFFCCIPFWMFSNGCFFFFFNFISVSCYRSERREINWRKRD